MRALSKAHSIYTASAGFGDLPQLRSRQNEKGNLSEKGFAACLKASFSVCAVMGEAFAQCFSRGENAVLIGRFAIDKTGIG